MSLMVDSRKHIRRQQGSQVIPSYGLKLVAHEPFVSRTIAIREETDIHSDTIVINKVTKRKCVMDTDNGKALQEKVADLEQLLWAYQKGLITERI